MLNWFKQHPKASDRCRQFWSQEMLELHHLVLSVGSFLGAKDRAIYLCRFLFTLLCKLLLWFRPGVWVVLARNRQHSSMVYCHGCWQVCFNSSIASLLFFQHLRLRKVKLAEENEMMQDRQIFVGAQGISLTHLLQGETSSPHFHRHVVGPARLYVTWGGDLKIIMFWHCQREATTQHFVKCLLHIPVARHAYLFPVFAAMIVCL